MPKIVFGIEENKPECIRHYQALVAQEENMEVCPLPAIYPQGGEKILIYHVMHKVVEEGNSRWTRARSSSTARPSRPSRAIAGRDCRW